MAIDRNGENNREWVDYKMLVSNKGRQGTEYLVPKI